MSLHTVLHSVHVAMGAKMMEFGGWDMPLQYDGIMAEHGRVRGSVGMFDTSHMDAFLLEGTESLDALSKVVTQNLRTLAVGACRYGFMLNEAGGVIDDLIVYRMGTDSWMPVVNAGTAESDFAWVQQHCAGRGCVVRDLRQQQGKLDVQGPNTAHTLLEAMRLDIATLQRFRWMCASAIGHEWIVSRTGYTGEDGVELYGSHEAVVAAWHALTAMGVKPCGLGARDTLRLEAGYPLYGHEFDVETSPAEAQMMRYCAKDEPFIGREALLRRAVAPTKLLVRFALEGRQTARHGQLVCDSAGTEIGRVTSGSFAPTLGRAIGFAYVRPDLAQAGTRIAIDNGRALLPATVTEKW